MQSVVMPNSICHAQPKNCLYQICCTMITSVAYSEPPPYAAFDLSQYQPPRRFSLKQGQVRRT